MPGTSSPGEIDRKEILRAGCGRVSGVVRRAAFGAWAGVVAGTQDAARIHRTRTGTRGAGGCGACGVSFVAVCEERGGKGGSMKLVD